MTFTDDAGNEESLTSLTSGLVAATTNNAVWSADMLVVEYTGISIGAASADLFSNIGGSGNLRIKSLWSYVPDKDLRLAFTDTFDAAEDHTLIVGGLTLEFPAGSSGEQSFKWTGVDLDWQDGQTIAVSIVPTTPAEPVANTAATGLPTVSGTPQVGETLTADTSAIADADGLTGVSYSYRWIANNGTEDTDLQGATASTYTPPVSAVGKTIKVRVTFTDDANNEETLTSAATVAVAARPNSPATGLPAITGTPRVGETLTASTSDIADADGLTNVSYSYQWIAGGSDIDGATSSNFTLTASQQGQTIQVKADFEDDRNNAETLTSIATAQVEARPNTPATGEPAISGTPQVGETLTASTSDIADTDGLTNVSYGYQWIAGGSDILGATDSTYNPADSDVGKAIQVKVSFADDAGNPESLTSVPTGAVAPRSPLTASFQSKPSTHDGQTAFTFELRFSEELRHQLQNPAGPGLQRHRRDR